MLGHGFLKMILNVNFIQESLKWISILSELYNCQTNCSQVKHRHSQTLLYVGPQYQEDLKKLENGLDLVVDYGMLTLIAKPIFWLLDKLYNIVGNWGWAIVSLTIIIKLFLSFNRSKLQIDG